MDLKKQTDIAVSDVILAFFRRLPLWIILFLLAGAAVMAAHYFLTDHATAKALVIFSYDGIESGRDPSGNRFDEQEIKSEDRIRAAADALSLVVTEEEIPTIQSAISIQGVVPPSVFSRIIDYHSVFGDDEVEISKEIKEMSYFPSQYTLTFHYAQAGFSADQGVRFLGELLSTYEDYFYERYGYNRALEYAVSSMDYGEYDYINAVDILGDRLSSLRACLSSLAALDNTRFVSTETGYSFSDLIDSIDTIRNEDIDWVTSYIIVNNITKNKQDLIDYYLYRIAEGERELAQRQSRLYTLTTQIEGYVKTTAIFLGIVNSDVAGQDGSNYEFTQQSRMYDALINEKVSCETSISETQEKIALYQQRLEKLRSSESTGDPALVEASLEKIDAKVGRFLEDTRRTAEDYYRSVQLVRAFQVLEEPTSTEMQVIPLLLESLRPLMITELALFGLILLRIPRAARRDVCKRTLAAEKKRAASQEGANARQKNMTKEAVTT